MIDMTESPRRPYVRGRVASPKVCEHCGETFGCRAGEYPTQFEKRRFCSQPCSRYFAIAHRATFVCAECGKSETRRSPSQQFCQECGQRRARTRGREWARRNPATDAQADRNVVRSRQRRADRRTVGFARSAAEAESISWDADAPIELRWLLRFSFPFHVGLSKNFSANAYRGRANDAEAWRKEVTELRAEIRAVFARAFDPRRSGQRVVHNKVWLDILVQKPNHKFDAVNVVDTVCDALTKTTGIDDRWFCIRRLDWQIVKDSPRVFIGVGQEATEDARVCSYCGRILQLSAFYLKSNDPLGVGRVCRECTIERLATEREARDAL